MESIPAYNLNQNYATSVQPLFKRFVTHKVNVLAHGTPDDAMMSLQKLVYNSPLTKDYSSG